MTQRKNTRSASPSPTSRKLRKEEEEADYEEMEVSEEEETVEEHEEKMLKLLEKAVVAIDSLRKGHNTLKAELESLKAKDDYPEEVDAPAEGVEYDEIDHDGTEEEQENEHSEEASVAPVSDNVGTEDAFTGKSVQDILKSAVREALAEQKKDFDAKLKQVVASTPRPMTFAKSGSSPEAGLRGLINKAVQADREACGVHSTVGATEVFGFKSGRADDSARKKMARWMTKMQEEY